MALNTLSTNPRVFISDNDESVQTQPQTSTKRLGRKRYREPHKHEKAIRKMKRNHGEEYVSVSKKLVPAKQFTSPDCKCKNKCLEKVPEDARKRTFEKFWKIGNFSTQNAFLCGAVKQYVPEVRRPRNGTRSAKTATNKFFINVESSVQVCKKFFIDTYKISNGRLSRALARGRTSSPGEDLRGKHPPANKTAEENVEAVRKHIDSFPVYQSHYTRAHNPNKKYLDTNLNIRTMFNLYKEKSDQENTIAVSEAMYRKIFHRDFNLSFHVPLKDTCSKCDTWTAKINITTDEEEKHVLQIQRDLHLRKAEKVRECLKIDKAASIVNKGKLYAFTFDLQKSLPFPVLTCSVAYYKRNMYVYNLGIHVLSEEEQAFMYAWDETISSRGAQEIGSCLRKHILTHAKFATHIIAYSDACGGQNRNLKQCLLWLKLLTESEVQLEEIDHKFMTTGHSFLPNDRDFGVIEQYAKNRVKYVPDDWYSIITKCKTRNPFQLYKMQRNDFVSTDLLEKAVTRRKNNTNNDKVCWLQIQWLHFKKSEPYKIFYKETLNEAFPFEVIDLLPSKKGRATDFKNIKLPVLHQSSLRINAKKKKNMEELYQFIPPLHQDFFKKIEVTNQETEGNDIGPLENILLDEELN